MRRDLRGTGKRAPRASAEPPAWEDLNEQLQCELDQLRGSEERLTEALSRRTVLGESAPVALLSLDGAGLIEHLNPAALELLQTDRSRAVGRPFRLFLEPAARRVWDRHLPQARRELAAPLRLELLVAVKGGARVPVEAVIGDGSPGWTVALLDAREWAAHRRDHDRLVEAEREAREASKAKDGFLAMLSHELRTPLTPVLAGLNVWDKRRPTRPQLDEWCRMIERNIRAQVRLIDDLLDITYITRGRLRLARETVDVHAVVRGAADPLTAAFKAKGVSLTLALEAERSVSLVDADRLRQVFSNLLANALKFTPARGRVSVRSWSRKSSLVVEISDSGVGMTPAALESMFRPFEQRQVEGTTAGGLGLGLAISRGIVELHEGTLTAHSPGPGLGARFLVELSTVAARPRATGPRPVAAQRKRTDAAASRVLLVDDNRDTLQVLAHILETHGFTVIPAATLRAAVKSHAQGIDLVVTDIGLPDGDGWELMGKLRRKGPVRAIALSGYGSDGDLAASRDAGFLAHLVKPVSVSVLVRTMKMALRSAPAAQRTAASQGPMRGS